MFIPRHPVVENQFCSYGSQTGSGAAGIGGVIAYAGSVVYLDPSATNEEAVVFKMAAGVTETPFGFSMQKVKTGYHQVHPAGMVLPGDLGSSDVIAQPLYNASGAITGTKAAPVGVAHLGIWDTVHYTCTGAEAGTVSAKMTPGQLFMGSG
jgi:predicted YcjX-like family ATPase